MQHSDDMRRNTKQDSSRVQIHGAVSGMTTQELYKYKNKSSTSIENVNKCIYCLSFRLIYIITIAIFT